MALLDLHHDDGVHDDVIELEPESFDAGPGDVCAECHDVSPGDKLFSFLGHSGAFCSRDCCARYYGLKR
jgi:hypothetical protein